MTAPAIRWALVVLLLPCLNPLLSRIAAGQTPGTDSLAVTAPDDSTGTPPPADESGPPQRERPTPTWFPASHERRLTSDPMVRTRFSHAAEALSENPLSFVYDMGIPGRPSAWSLGGLPPITVGATLNDFEFVDPVTRTPLLHLYPFELLEPLSTSWGRLGTGPTVSARIRPLAGRPPLTEIRYDQGSNKLQSVSVFHAQDRSRTVRGNPTRLNLLFRYGGRGSTGAYPGSKTRLRQIYLRLIHERPGRLVEMSYLRTRSEWSGQSGVLPAPGAGFDSIYETFSPTVRTATADGRIDRHDATVRLRSDLFSPRLPLTAGIRVSPQINHASVSNSSFRVPSLQAGYFLIQPLGTRAGHHPEFVHSVNVTRIRTNTAFTDSSAARYVAWSVGLRDSTSVLGGNLTLELRLASTTEGPRPRFGGTFVRAIRAAEVRVEGAVGHRDPSHVDRFGFGSSLTGLDGARSASTALLQASVLFRLGSIGWETAAFASSIGHPIDYWAVSSLLSNTGTVARVVQGEGTHRWFGGSSSLSWRQFNPSGLFARAHVAFTQPSASVDGSGPHASTALPKWRTEGRIGTRSRLFEGDLRLTAFLRGRLWSAFRSRTFQPETGLFMLPAADDLVLGPSGSLDVIAEGGVRTATLFLTLENVLAGTIYPGTLLVPLYPLPKRALRFGVYWPLRN